MDEGPEAQKDEASSRWGCDPEPQTCGSGRPVPATVLPCSPLCRLQGRAAGGPGKGGICLHPACLHLPRGQALPAEGCAYFEVSRLSSPSKTSWHSLA